MKMIRKLAPRRLARAILALASGTGNGMIKVSVLDKSPKPESFNADPDLATGARVNTRTTITIETERLIVVSHIRSRRKDQIPSCLDQNNSETGGSYE
jgi:hypothetical protein